MIEAMKKKKKDDEIPLSPKHGLNPSIAHCECCGEEIGIALLGRLENDEEAPRDIALGLCDTCKGVIDKGGVMVIEVRDGESSDNPYRTGRLVGCSKQFKERMNIDSPIIYMEESVFSIMFDEAISEDNEKKED